MYKNGDGQVKIEYIQGIAHANIMYIMVCIIIHICTDRFYHRKGHFNLQ